MSRAKKGEGEKLFDNPNDEEKEALPCRHAKVSSFQSLFFTMKKPEDYQSIAKKYRSYRLDSFCVLVPPCRPQSGAI